MKNWFQKAREAAGLSPEECASVLLNSHDSFARKEKNPGTFTLNELRALHSVFNEDARKIVREALRDIYL